MTPQLENALYAIGGAFAGAAASAVFGRWGRRAEARDQRVQEASVSLRRWVWDARSLMNQRPPTIPPVREAHDLVVIIGIEPLRTLFVTWYNYRVEHALGLERGVEMYPVDQLRWDAAVWRAAERDLDRALDRLVAGRRWPGPATRWRIWRLWRRSTRRG